MSRDFAPPAAQAPFASEGPDLEPAREDGSGAGSDGAATTACVPDEGALPVPYPSSSDAPAPASTTSGTSETSALHLPPVLPSDYAALKATLDHRQRQIDALRRASEAFFVQPSIDLLIRHTLNLAAECVGADAGSLLLHDPVKDTLVFRYVIGDATEKLVGYSMPSGEGIAGRVYRTGLSDITKDTAQQPDFNRGVDERTGFRTRSMITVPVKRHGGPPTGVMQILNFNEEYDACDLEVLEVIADQAAIAIENARLSQNARKAELVNLIGDVSHDIKNMLTPIQTGVWTLEPMLSEMFKELDDLLTQDPQAPWCARVAKATDLVRTEHGWILENALTAAERVQERTKEIADVIKGESSPPRFALDDFNNLVREVYTSLRIVTYDHQIDLELDLDPALPLVEIDHKQVYNALYNLVNNAIPETPEGGMIVIRSRALSGQDSNFLFEVSDNGRGMAPDIRDKLFTDEAISTKPGGTGLGTRIVADVVRRHRGHIAVQSETGKGTTFTIMLPVRQIR